MIKWKTEEEIFVLIKDELNTELVINKYQVNINWVEVSTIFTQNDYKILKSIVDRGDRKKGMCKTNGTTIKEIIDKTELSDKKIRNTLKQFLDVGFISEGASIGKARTYMLTKEGFLELKSLRINIFGEV